MKPRIEALPDDRVPAGSVKTLERTRAAVGRIPNLHRTLAHSPAALEAYASMAGALKKGALSPRLAESIALASAGLQGCAYCASAHTAIGKGVGLDEGELASNLGAGSSDPRTAAALAFVRSLVERRGAVSDEELSTLRAAGFSDEELVEIVAHVALNTFTNTFNVLARTAIDFPLVELAGAR